MQAILKLLTQCFNPSSYQPLPKKDDDDGIEEAKAWKETHKVDESIGYKKGKGMEKYIDDIVKGLKRFRITSANKEIVKEHICAIAIWSNWLRNQLIDELASCKGDQALVLEIRNALASIMCKMP